jgi:orotate phosphoribosyltransferase
MFSNSFPEKEFMAAQVARMLFEIKAVHFNAREPYTFTSGLKSPVYIDCRKPISYPRIRSAMMDFAVSVIARDVGYEQFDSVAGGETAGIPFAAWIADRMALPMRNAQIEGDLKEGARVLFVEDLTTDGGSKFLFANAIRKAGGVCTDTFSIFYYDIFKDTPAKLAEQGMRLHYLCTWHDVLAEARRSNLFDAETLTQVQAFLAAPLAWSAAHGGITELPSRNDD